MALEMVFNELSGQTPAYSRDLGRQWMEEFLATIRTSRSAGISGSLRIPRRFQQLLLAPDYPVGRWAADSSVDLDHRRYFRTIATKAPYAEDILATSLKEAYALAEFTCEGQSVIGLAVAFLLDAISLSFISSDLWNRVNIPIRVVSIDASLIDLADEVLSIRNASHPIHVRDDHAPWISARRAADIVDGNDLWERRYTLFESLDFCLELELQFRDLSANDPCFVFAIDGLLRLQNFCKNWTEPRFDPSSVGNCSTESEVTLQQYGAERTFTDFSGVKRLFSWHLKKYNLRMYFVPSPQAKRILVGYVGRHLRTVKYRS